jgi:hypothetical protein
VALVSSDIYNIHYGKRTNVMVFNGQPNKNYETHTDLNEPIQ